MLLQPQIVLRLPPLNTKYKFWARQREREHRDGRRSVKGRWHLAGEGQWVFIPFRRHRRRRPFKRSEKWFQRRARAFPQTCLTERSTDLLAGAF